MSVDPSHLSAAPGAAPAIPAVQAVTALGWSSADDPYQSPLRDLAAVIALAYEAGETALARSLQSRLERSIVNPDRLNTVEQSYLVRAGRAMLAASGPMNIKASGVALLGAGRWSVGRLAQARFVNAGSGALWRTVTVHGAPLSAPPPSESGMLLDKSLLSMTGARVDPSQIRQGQRLIIRLAGAALAQREITAVLDDALPAGFEIESVLTPEDAQGAPGQDGKTAAGPFAFLGKLTETTVQEKRDDRYVAVLKISDARAFVTAYVVRAVTPGDFFLPGAEVKDMYRPEVNARTSPRRTQIAPVQ